MKAEEFIRELRRTIRFNKDKRIYWADEALARLLDHDIEAWREYFEKFHPVVFHKLLREQGDVFDHPDIDMAVWHLIGISEVFWTIMEDSGHNIEKPTGQKLDYDAALVTGYGQISFNGVYHALKENNTIPFCETRAFKNFQIFNDTTLESDIIDLSNITCKYCISKLKTTNGIV